MQKSLKMGVSTLSLAAAISLAGANAYAQTAPAASQPSPDSAGQVPADAAGQAPAGAISQGPADAPGQAPTDAERSPSDADIVVTGSRIVADGFQAPTPVTVVSTEQLQRTAPGAIPEGLNQLPQFAGSRSNTTPGGLGNTPSTGNYLNLRNLGALPQPGAARRSAPAADQLRRHHRRQHHSAGARPARRSRDRRRLGGLRLGRRLGRHQLHARHQVQWREGPDSVRRNRIWRRPDLEGQHRFRRQRPERPRSHPGQLRPLSTPRASSAIRRARSAAATGCAPARARWPTPIRSSRTSASRTHPTARRSARRTLPPCSTGGSGTTIPSRCAAINSCRAAWPCRWTSAPRRVRPAPASAATVRSSSAGR